MGHYIEVEKGIKLFVEDIGEGKPVIFLHGWPANQRMFEYQANALIKEGYRFIGIDMRGYGKSDKPHRGYDYNRMADDLREVIDQLEITDATLLGFSMGGAISIRYMARHLEHGVSKLILAGAAAPAFTNRENFSAGIPKENVDELIQASSTNRPAMLHDFGGQFFSQGVCEHFADWFKTLTLEAGGHATIQSAEALREEDLRPCIDNISVPTAIFHGEKDKICPFDLAKEMEKSIQNSTLIPFANSGHSLFYDEQEKFNEELIRFHKD
ncbi:alpha/beta fold hydrolase [Alkalihalobacillus pseudalcaliphilus]|uniref:alpha/beta fold hydrolase n=1 Tax=Alkalihalobacillus pseudalcaliphilus TaxID=79884 RepID=UPI00064DCB51|nr:alpha/beta hydrolase [Alkalihalobacillus pseudalcaliphilus]KMK77844.1 alpha/beta hydrolase [Alkalihalobacillus pseudalcaliphilus]